ncbi:hypothetical protein GQ44DRAFT_827823 [Phaeosphaeriaceae sp. PMI808]|nr:hypothetical protein GQ44DRAFT_827823 [Phaeosphaeriaceae sp. PMI808]
MPSDIWTTFPVIPSNAAGWEPDPDIIPKPAAQLPRRIQRSTAANMNALSPSLLSAPATDGVPNSLPSTDPSHQGSNQSRSQHSQSSIAPSSIEKNTSHTQGEKTTLQRLIDVSETMATSSGKSDKGAKRIPTGTLETSASIPSLEPQFSNQMQASEMDISEFGLEDAKQNRRLGDGFSTGHSDCLHGATMATTDHSAPYRRYLRIESVLSMQKDLWKQELLALSDEKLEERLLTVRSAHEQLWEARLSGEEGAYSRQHKRTTSGNTMRKESLVESGAEDHGVYDARSFNGGSEDLILL